MKLRVLKFRLIAASTVVAGMVLAAPAHADPSPTPNPPPPASATAQCCDSSYSFSQHRSGTCSHHGGVCQWCPCGSATGQSVDGTYDDNEAVIAARHI
ncbi:MAG TPA: DUF3761 domain-containing protein [Mycobacterium sp.]|nr:DUF3761 domain-containing protein [Mycobacterium sp.]